jgi:hypothetical protein
MSSTSQRQQIINSLLKYLPDISVSLNNLVIFLKETIADQRTNNNDSITSVGGDLKVLVNSLISANSEVILIVETPEEVADIIDQYREFIDRIVDGLTMLVDWLKEDGQPDKNLEQAVNHLFLAGQSILKLVESITES